MTHRDDSWTLPQPARDCGAVLLFALAVLPIAALGVCAGVVDTAWRLSAGPRARVLWRIRYHTVGVPIVRHPHGAPGYMTDNAPNHRPEETR